MTKLKTMKWEGNISRMNVKRNPLKASGKTERYEAIWSIQRYMENNINMDLNVITSVVHWPEFLTADPEVPCSIPALPYFLSSTGSGTGSTQPREDT
jgi:hypothetical protein